MSKAEAKNWAQAGKNIGPPVKAKECAVYLICDTCGHYPLEPVHGHYFCQECRNVTKCCEGS